MTSLKISNNELPSDFAYNLPAKDIPVDVLPIEDETLCPLTGNSGGTSACMGGVGGKGSTE